MGWVQKSRNKGGIVFVDLRDRSGILQVIFEDGDIKRAKKLFEKGCLELGIKKEDVLNSKKGKIFVTPNNESYIFDWEKRGRKYVFIIEYKGIRMQVLESIFNTTPIDTWKCRSSCRCHPRMSPTM